MSEATIAFDPARYLNSPEAVEEYLIASFEEAAEFGDPRIITKPYGRRIWQSLPSFKRTRVQEEVIQFFRPVEEADENVA